MYSGAKYSVVNEEEEDDDEEEETEDEDDDERRGPGKGTYDKAEAMSEGRTAITSVIAFEWLREDSPFAIM